ncbi:MAG: hypothetical protein R3A80_12145 [Bdellovibrionota bacterium]
MLGKIKKLLLLSFLSLNLSALATEVLSDNLPPLDGKIYEFKSSRPSLFNKDERSVFIRREKVSVEGINDPKADIELSILSGSGSTLFRDEETLSERAKEKAQEIRFESISGKPEYPSPVEEVKVLNQNSFVNGLNLQASASLAQLAGDIYLEFPLAAKRFTQYGFNEQHFIYSPHPDIKAAVLKNKDAIIITVRGTEPTSIKNWMTNAKFFQVPVIRGQSVRAHLGFSQAAADIMPFVRSEISSTLENKIRSLIAKIAANPEGALKLASYGITAPVSAPDTRPIYLTGHSLGGAIATLLYGELTLSWLDENTKGYYFIDPVLSKVSDENINKLIADTLAAEQFYQVGEERSFSFYEEDAFRISNSLKHLAVIRVDTGFSAAPAEDIQDLTVDRRLKALVTFGAPRALDWPFKYALESYASATGSTIVRFENFFPRPHDGIASFLADLVPRVPLERVGSGLFFPEYTHAGFRASFETEDEDPEGNPKVLFCTYTNKASERNLMEYAIPSFSLTYHKMSLYLKRISSYIKADESLDSSHPCKSLKYEYPESI